MNPVFIRKKYNSFQDEVTLQKQTGPVYENKKRVEAIKDAIQNKADIAILDDGFQDFSIYKNFSIVCFNEKQWIGNGLVIPSGPLREDISALKRANCAIVNGEKNINIENKILNENKEIKIFYTKYTFENTKNIENQKVTAFAGIGNPENFFSLLKDSNIDVVKQIEFPDHYNYSKKELENLVNKAKKNNTILVTTEKDYFRINEMYKQKVNYLKILVKIENRDQFIKEIKKFI